MEIKKIMKFTSVVTAELVKNFSQHIMSKRKSAGLELVPAVVAIEEGPKIISRDFHVMLLWSLARPSRIPASLFLASVLLKNIPSMTPAAISRSFQVLRLMYGSTRFN